MDFQLPDSDDPRRVAVREWLNGHPNPTNRQLAETGYVAPQWPAPWGLGADPIHQLIIDDELSKAGVRRPVNPIGIGWAGPTLLYAGSDEQKARYLLPMLSGEEFWCQLFSEPASGSDLASLGTRAVRDGDEFVVNGQKIWTSGAQHAAFGILLARTDPDVPKHKGISYFICPMRSAGIEIRPITEMTGGHTFNEVFFTDVRIPDSERLGDVGEGWGVSLTTLMNERVSIGGQIAPRGGGFIGEAVKLWKKRGITDPAKRDELMKLWVRAEVLRLTNIRASQLRTIGTPGPEGSIGKAAAADFNKDVSEFCVDLLGADGMLKPDGYPMARPEHTMLWSNPQQAFLRMRANSIEGGTTEIMKNILGERVLGLPGDVRVDKALPWSQVPRS
jgi:alkylation response protein AidB-like acyl-CoA dehydrogenase